MKLEHLYYSFRANLISYRWCTLPIFYRRMVSLSLQFLDKMTCDFSRCNFKTNLNQTNPKICDLFPVNIFLCETILQPNCLDKSCEISGIFFLSITAHMFRNCLKGVGTRKSSWKKPFKANICGNFQIY